MSFGGLEGAREIAELFNKVRKENLGKTERPRGRLRDVIEFVQLEGKIVWALTTDEYILPTKPDIVIKGTSHSVTIESILNSATSRKWLCLVKGLDPFNNARNIKGFDYLRVNLALSIKGYDGSAMLRRYNELKEKLLVKASHKKIQKPRI